MRSLVFAAIWFGVAFAITGFVADSLQKWRLSQVRAQHALTVPQGELPFTPANDGRVQQVSGTR
jgi:hypothetical protein